MLRCVCAAPAHCCLQAAAWASRLRQLSPISCAILPGFPVLQQCADRQPSAEPAKCVGWCQHEHHLGRPPAVPTIPAAHHPLNLAAGGRGALLAAHGRAQSRRMQPVFGGSTCGSTCLGLWIMAALLVRLWMVPAQMQSRFLRHSHHLRRSWQLHWVPPSRTIPPSAHTCRAQLPSSPALPAKASHVRCGWGCSLGCPRLHLSCCSRPCTGGMHLCCSLAAACICQQPSSAPSPFPCPRLCLAHPACRRHLLRMCAVPARHLLSRQHQHSLPPLQARPLLSRTRGLGLPALPGWVHQRTAVGLHGVHQVPHRLHALARPERLRVSPCLLELGGSGAAAQQLEGMFSSSDG